ncbi:MAG: hypothetical protein ACUBOA_11090 [Candidatus Loosdrechtia sp.]|uniref:hypothetical protein n=1 Tax=Candidatus Loosdrechtia sp. TaxID=3101272 RepID=UPI003A6C39A0|nr:MAG: hypothetical protein QY305_11835 [Candidatus Jettenia sp. AMX2]
MNIPEINNSYVITETLTKGITGFNGQDCGVFNNNLSEQYSFEKILRRESGEVNSFGRQQREEIGVESVRSGILTIVPERLSANKTDIGKPSKFSILEQYKQYKEDQLLSNPGGDNYFLNKSTEVREHDYDHSRFTKRMEKNLTDAGSNIRNAVDNLGAGAKFKYVCQDGHVKDGRKVGLTATVANFFRNMMSGVTLGLYTPEGESQPVGLVGRAKHFFRKIFKNALFEDVLKGIPGSVNNVVKDITLAGLNTVENVPDATLGNCKPGRNATTAIFDNVQVFISFIMDILPGGAAYTRTRSFNFKRGIKGLPVVHNITMPDDNSSGKEWKYVRNTGFRKTIESIPSFFLSFFRI